MIDHDNTVWVKICGLTRPADVEMVTAAGADAIGLNRVSSSPRCVTEEQVIELAGASLLPAIVLVEDMDPTQIVVYLDQLGVDGVQPYGQNASAVAGAAAEAGWLALLPTAVGAVPELPDGVIPLLDTADPERLGGTGRTFEWSAIDRRIGRFVLAGGLGPDNVAKAIRVTGAWGVDASSRLEAEVGVKDVGKVTAFVREAKQA